jgi:hypothetical protein
MTDAKMISKSREQSVEAESRAERISSECTMYMGPTHIPM